MGRWAFTLGGLIVWAVHFLGVYAIASLADTVSRADAYGWRMIGLAFSGACVVAALACLLAALWRLRLGGEPQVSGRFMSEIAALGAGLSVLAIAWQALPTLTGY
ncbi:MAG: hypothetical protein V4466_14515 [Pseudomonadota bacterium]